MRRQKNTAENDRQQAYHLAQQGDFDQARQLLERQLLRDKTDAQSWYMLASVYARLGQLSESEKAFRNALRHNSKIPDICCSLATVLGLQGRHAEAEQYFSKQVNLQPGHPHALLGLARSIAAQGKLVSAISHYHSYFRYEPESLEPIIELGNLYWQCGEIKEAQAWYLRAEVCNPQSALALSNIGLTYQHQGCMDTAIDYYLKALQAQPDYMDAQYNLGTAFTYLGDYDQAIEWFKQVISIAPDNEQAIGALADVYHKSGDQEASYRLVRPVAQAGSQNVNIAVVYAQTSNRLNKEDDALSRLQALVDSGELHNSAQRLACFTLGKLYDRLEMYEQAFKHYVKGNALVRDNYNIDALKNHIGKLEHIFDEVLFSKRQLDIIDDTPIFIVGMPRSGTSLVEQILASHSRVTGAGELTYLPELVSELSREERYTVPYPESMREVHNHELSELAQRYLGQIRTFSADAARITDKLPNNYLHLGLIAILFPNAHIIHCRRDPVDTCLSCYFQNFGGTHTYSSDLDALAAYYRLYDQIMAHWHAVLPMPILDFSYEELVMDQAGMSRKLVEFCGLEWEEACLAFHKHQRKTTTASYEQVNQPLYKQSVARWKHYEAWLGDLLEGLEASD